MTQGRRIALIVSGGNVTREQLLEVVGREPAFAVLDR